MNPLFGGIVGQDPYSLTVRLSTSILATFPIGAQETNMSLLLFLPSASPSGSCPFFDRICYPSIELDEKMGKRLV